jgi:hypothetical protein
MRDAGELSLRRKWLWLFVVACGVQAIILAAVAVRRGVNADEGFYMVAGWRVLGGQRPYRDFFFPQMPYTPYVEAAMLMLTGPSLLAGRMISVAAGALCAGLLALAAARRSNSLPVGIAVALAYAGNALTLSYLPIAKPYAIANLGLIGAFLLVAAPAAGVTRVFIAGVSAGFAVGVRLPAIAAAVPLLWCCRHSRRQMLAFAGGALVASVPWLWMAALDPQGFWFCNVGFHALRREISGLGPIMAQKGLVLAKWVLLPQNLVLWLLALAGLRVGPGQAFPAMACALGLAAAYFLATPTYLEYMVQVVPFLLLAAVPALALGLSRRGLIVTGACLYLAGLLLARRAALEDTPRGVKAQLWRLVTVQTVADYLHNQSAPGDRILSWWEGYPFLAQRAGFAGVGFWESNAAKKLSIDKRRRFHVLAREDIRHLVATRQPRLIVFPEGTWGDLQDEFKQHYRPVARFGTIHVLERRGADVST